MFLSLACFPRDLPSRARVRSGTSQAGVNPFSTSANESDDHAFIGEQEQRALHDRHLSVQIRRQQAPPLPCQNHRRGRSTVVNAISSTLSLAKRSYTRTSLLDRRAR